MDKKETVILLIDDDTRLLSGTHLFLSQNGYSVLVSKDVPTAIKILEEQIPDLIICDVMMPEMNGFEFRMLLNQNPETESIPFLFLTAKYSNDDILFGFDIGCDDYITKPFNRNEFLARINAILKRVEKGRKSAEQDMNNSFREFQQEVLNNAHHELYTPLTLIMASLELVLRDRYQNPEEMKSILNDALSGTQQMKLLIDDLILLTYIDQNKLPNLRSPINLRFDFYEPIKKRAEYYLHKNITIHYDTDDDIQIFVPRKNFSHVISHLVDNALKFSPEGKEIFIKLKSQGYGGCVLTITDQGAGIPQELYEKVFERYYQISKGLTRKYNGLGIGLYIARAITRSIGGDIEFLPVSEGCCVQMTIPPLEEETLLPKLDQEVK